MGTCKGSTHGAFTTYRILCGPQITTFTRYPPYHLSHPSRFIFCKPAPKGTAPVRFLCTSLTRPQTGCPPNLLSIAEIHSMLCIDLTPGGRSLCTSFLSGRCLHGRIWVFMRESRTLQSL